MRLLKFVSIFILLLSGTSAFNQVLTWTPEYPTINDTITITYDASLGNGALTDVASVYAHTGVISNFGANLSDWQHKVAEWDEADSLVLMENLGNNLHQIKFRIKSFYGISTTSGEIVTNLAFVFRNSDGTIAGKDADDSDFYIPVFESGKHTKFVLPREFPLNPAAGQSISFKLQSTGTAMMNLFHDNVLVNQAYGTTLSHTITAAQTGKHWVKFISEAGGVTVKDSMYYIIKQNNTIADPPSGIKDGINYINDSTVILCLYAPYKSNVYLIGDFNDFQPDPDYLMNKTNDGKRYWIQLTNLTPAKEYRFQYYVDLDIRIADPYCDKVLDQYNDLAINSLTYPGLIGYPKGKTSEMVGVFQTAQTAYTWNDTSFQRPDNRDLVIYELLVRDFCSSHLYKTVKDTIDHLVKLGINAIELMPVMEFDGNDSWGYGPAFYFAPDKYYGTKSALKDLINEAHNKGIAIILDIVLNHAYYQNPWVRLYFDRNELNVTTQNPWFNNFIPHPFGFKYDFNHASTETQNFVDSVLSYWTKEYHVDGFRFDLSKGFTNNNTGEDVGAWGQKDDSRIYYLERLFDHFRANVDGSSYMILEHFANNDEEQILSGHGFMLWGKASSSYGDAAMGYTSNFSWDVSYKDRGWAFHNLVGFMESHDEERMMYKTLTWGNETASYTTKQLDTALQRMALCGALFFTVPGPKMIWQFEELGYDYSILYPTYTDESRTIKKPVKWNYKQEQNRHLLYKIYSAFIKLKTQYPLFKTSNYEISAGNYDKRIRLWDDGYVGSDMSAVAIGNFDVVSQSVWPEFSHTGWWYDYLTSDSIYIDNGQTENNGFTLQYAPGEYHVYTDKKLPKPDLSVPSLAELVTGNSLAKTYAFPNPFNTKTSIGYNLTNVSDVSIEIYDVTGNKIWDKSFKNVSAGEYEIEWNGCNTNGKKLPTGSYFYRIRTNQYSDSGKLLHY